MRSSLVLLRNKSNYFITSYSHYLRPRRPAPPRPLRPCGGAGWRPGQAGAGNPARPVPEPRGALQPEAFQRVRGGGRPTRPRPAPLGLAEPLRPPSFPSPERPPPRGRTGRKRRLSASGWRAQRGEEPGLAGRPSSLRPHRQRVSFATSASPLSFPALGSLLAGTEDPAGGGGFPSFPAGKGPLRLPRRMQERDRRQSLPHALYSKKGKEKGGRHTCSLVSRSDALVPGGKAPPPPTSRVQPPHQLVTSQGHCQSSWPPLQAGGPQGRQAGRRQRAGPSSSPPPPRLAGCLPKVTCAAAAAAGMNQRLGGGWRSSIAGAKGEGGGREGERGAGGRGRASGPFCTASQDCPPPVDTGQPTPQSRARGRPYLHRTVCSPLQGVDFSSTTDCGGCGQALPLTPLGRGGKVKKVGVAGDCEVSSYAKPISSSTLRGDSSSYRGERERER